MKRLAGCALVLALLSGAGAVAGSSDEEKIEAVIAGLIEAYRKGDTAALGRSYAAEVTVVPGDYNPPVRGWANVQPRYQQAFAALSGMEMVRENTQLVRRGNLAWAVYQWRVAGVAGPQTIGTQGHTTLILEKRKGEWLIVHNHTSAVLTPPEPEKPAPAKPAS